MAAIRTARWMHKVNGRFIHGDGTFYADDTLRGKPIKVRFVWSHITLTSLHWG
jgi:hypothetical protein